MAIHNKFNSGNLINFLLIVFQIGFLLMGFGLGLFILLAIVAFFTGSPVFPAGFTVMFSLSQDGIVNIPNQITGTTFNIENAMGIIGVDQLPKGFLLAYSGISVLANVCILYSLRWTINILEAAKQGDFLIIENAIRLRWIALLGIGCIFFDRLATIFASFYLYDKLEYPGLEFTNINFFSFMTLQSVFSFLFLWVIAEAFRIGSQMKQENDLTI